jgi:hypothetical protein
MHKRKDMKKVVNYVLIVFLIPACIGCKKDKDEPSKDLVGYWELAQAQGGMTPVTTYPAGNGSLLVIKDDTYAYYGNGQLVKKGTYATMEDNTVAANVCLVIPAGEFTRRIVFDTSYSAEKMFYNIADNNLTLMSGCFAVDGGRRTTYRKVQPNDTFPVE